jgi:hypothetical protein
MARDCPGCGRVLEAGPCSFCCGRNRFARHCEFQSRLSPGELAKRIRDWYFSGRPEQSGGWDSFRGHADDSGFELTYRGRYAFAARGLFEPGAATRVRLWVAPRSSIYMPIALLGVAPLAVIAYAAYEEINAPVEHFIGPITLTISACYLMGAVGLIGGMNLRIRIVALRLRQLLGGSA